MRKVYKSDRFLEQLNKLPVKLQIQVKKTVRLLQSDEFSSDLKVHMLQGKLAGIYSCSVDYSNRIIFRVIKNNNIELIVVGDHSIYKQPI